MSEELQALVILHPAPGKEDRVRELLLELASKVEQNEKDMPKFQAFEQYDSQTGTNVLIIQEIFANKAAIDAYHNAPYFVAVKDILPKEGLLAKPMEIIAIKTIGGFASR